MPHFPLFSVITVTLHNLNGLQATYESLEKQTCRNFEWIVIDGASDDGTAGWLKDSAALWMSEPDNGLYHAMNKGMDRANGNYCLFLNAGDRLADKDILQKIKDSLEHQKQPPGFIYGDSHEEHGGQLHYKPARPHTKPARGMFTHHQAMLYRRAAIGGLRYDLNYKIAADYDFTMRFLKTAENVLYCNVPVCIFESGGRAQQNAAFGRRELFKIRENLKIANLVANAGYYCTQTISWNLRRLFPAPYNKLRFRK